MYYTGARRESASERERLHDRVLGTRRQHALEAQTRAFEQRCVLGARALSAARDGEHDDVERLTEVRPRNFGD